MIANGLSLRFFRSRSALYGLVVRRIAGQMKTAQSLDRQDSTLLQYLPRFADFRKAAPSKVERRAQLVAQHQCKRRSALGTRVGLRVKTPVRWIFVLREAPFTHCEAGHGSQRPVIGNLPRDGVARAAVGAVGEWITVPAISCAAEIPQAVVAGGDIRRNRSQPSGLVHAFANHEARIAGRRQGLDRLLPRFAPGAEPHSSAGGRNIPAPDRRLPLR